jgi:small subunit ribosomal protein S17
MTHQSKHIERRIVGRVSSNKAAKTITVVVERQVKHPLYGKLLRDRKSVV